MTETFEPALLDLGPQVAIIDDVEIEALPISNALTELNIGNYFYFVDVANPHYPTSPLHNVELVFLDLHYNENYGARFEPEICCNILEKLVPKGKKYVLVVWSKDIEKCEELREAMKERGITEPILTTAKAKHLYQTDTGYDISKLLAELNEKLHEFTVTTQDFQGEVIEVDDNTVIVNCLLTTEPPVFEIRKFDRELFGDLYDLKPGNFFNIRITTRPGERNITFVLERNDISDRFRKPDGEPEDLSWLNDPTDEDNI